MSLESEAVRHGSVFPRTDRELRDEWLPRPFAPSPPEYYTGLVLKAGQVKTVAQLFREHIETERKERT